MTFAGVNYWAVLAAAVAAWILGAIWYTTLSSAWLDALGKTKEQIGAGMRPGTPAFYAPFVIAFVAELIMAWVLAGTMAHVGPITVRNGIISALFVWFGFVLTTTAVNYAFANNKMKLTAIDTGHWLAVLLVMGIVIGAFGL
jgi:Protein of unknown function (DUF1761)